MTARIDNQILVLQRWALTRGDNGKPHKVDEFTPAPVSSSESPPRSLRSRAQSPEKSICFLRDVGVLINHHLHDIFVLINLPGEEAKKGNWLTMNQAAKGWGE